MYCPRCGTGRSGKQPACARCGYTYPAGGSKSRLPLVLLILVVALGVAALLFFFSQNGRYDLMENPATSPQMWTGGGTAAGDIQGAGDITLTLPASFVGDAAQEELTPGERASGFYSKTVNEDGSVTMQISRPNYAQLVQQCRVSISEKLRVMPDEYDSFRELTVNEEFTEVTVTVDRAAYEGGLDRYALYTIWLQCWEYQTYAGVAESDQHMVVQIVDHSTGAAVGSQQYP